MLVGSAGSCGGGRSAPVAGSRRSSPPPKVPTQMRAGAVLVDAAQLVVGERVGVGRVVTVVGEAPAGAVEAVEPAAVGGHPERAVAVLERPPAPCCG